MDWNDQPAWVPAQPPPAAPAMGAPPTEPAPNSSFGGVRRGLATAALAIGLLVVGGTAAVLAADPSASAAPNATSQPSGGTTQPNGQAPTTRTHNCPNMGGAGSGGSTAPSTNGSTSSPPTSNL